ncbi:hypothetical protein AN958_01584 [Leucoagaricus sp. SymC.cos]|nr:hypothetical protein AN958_01584 [Leucoagaricus sp. SymC.cos]
MSANGIKIDAAELVGIICEGVFYGLFVGMFVGTVHVLTVGRLRHSTINVPMLGAAFLMMGLATAQLAVDSVNIFTAFIRKGDVGRAGRNAHLLDVTQPIFAAKHAIYFTMMFVGDAIVVSNSPTERKISHQNVSRSGEHTLSGLVGGGLLCFRHFVPWDQLLRPTRQFGVFATLLL